ncbi:MAG: ROK family protein [Clostridiaceae bacterium]|nr:ROK family protein [Clostridiaceae bacterium]
MFYYLGLDIGGSYLKLGLLNEEGQLLTAEERAHANVLSADHIVAEIDNMIVAMLRNAQLSVQDVRALGVGVPGYVDNETGWILNTNNLPFHLFPLRDSLNSLPGIPIYLANDANLAALAESRSGAGRSCNFMLMITLGTGIGGGIIINGDLYEGYNGAASELGHHVIRLGGEKCTCGRRGCYEVYASATALKRITAKAARENPKSGLAGLIAEHGGVVTGKTAFMARDFGDEIAAAVIAEYTTNVAEGCANLVNILMPELIVLGGGISQAGEDFLAEVAAKVYELIYLPPLCTRPTFALAELGNEAGVIGAAFYAMDCLNKGAK